MIQPKYYSDHYLTLNIEKKIYYQIESKEVLPTDVERKEEVFFLHLKNK